MPNFVFDNDSYMYRYSDSDYCFGKRSLRDGEVIEVINRELGIEYTFFAERKERPNAVEWRIAVPLRDRDADLDVPGTGKTARQLLREFLFHTEADRLTEVSFG